MALLLEIVTPEKTAFSDTVESVVLPGSDGQLGVLTSHEPIVTTLAPGDLAYTKGGKTEFLAIGSGFVEITGHNVRVITDMAMGENEIDEQAVEAALKRAQESAEKLANAPGGIFGEEYAALQATIAKSVAQLHVKRRRNQI